MRVFADKMLPRCLVIWLLIQIGGLGAPSTDWEAIEPLVYGTFGKVIETSSSRFVAAGRDREQLVAVVEFSNSGVVLRRERFSGARYDSHQPNSLLQLLDGSIVIAGNEEFSMEDVLGAAFVFKLSPDLQLMWWSDVEVGTYKNGAKDVVASSDSTLAIAGFAVELDGPSNWYGSFAALDAAGNVLTTNRYESLNEEPEPAFIRDELFNSIDSVAPNSFMMAGMTQLKYWLLEVDSQGTILWQKILGGGVYDEAAVVKVLNDGGLIIGGSSISPIGGDKASPHFGQYDFWVIRLDSERNIVWQQSYGGSGHDIMATLDVTPDGGFILGGWTDSPVSGNKTAAHRGKKDYWVIRTDAQGEVLWEETYGGSEDDELVSIEQTSDGGYIIGGNSSSGADGNKTKPETGWWIIKLAAEGAARLSAPAQSAADIAAEGFRMTLSGAAGTSYVLERSADLSDWTPISTNLLTESEMELRDPAPGAEMNFYRTRTQFQDGRIE